MRTPTTRVDRSFARCPLLPVPTKAGGKGAEHGGGQGLVHCATHAPGAVATSQALPRRHWLVLEQSAPGAPTHRKFPLPSTLPKVPPSQDDPQLPIELLTWKQPPWTES